MCADDLIKKRLINFWPKKRSRIFIEERKAVQSLPSSTMSWAATEFVYTTKSESSRQSFTVFLRRPNLWDTHPGAHDISDLEEAGSLFTLPSLTAPNGARIRTPSVLRSSALFPLQNPTYVVILRAHSESVFSHVFVSSVVGLILTVTHLGINIRVHQKSTLVWQKENLN